MGKQDVYFMAGFPRAGSTLLMNILNQNPKMLGTPTSGLITSVINIRDNWRANDIYKSNEETYVFSKIKTMLRGMINGFYDDELKQGIVPVDKNRMWVSHLDLLDELYDTKVKFIYPIRDLVDVLVSTEKIRRKSKINSYGYPANDGINELTTIGRSENSLKDDGMIGLPILHLREIIYRKEWDRLALVVYDDLLNYPEQTMKRLYNQMGLEYFDHDFNNIKQTLVEHDIHHGYAPNSLHKIKEGQLLPPNPRDLTIFDEKYMNHIENEKYNDITTFINNNRLKFK